MSSILQKVKSFESFIDFKPRALPIISACPNGWESFSLYVKNTRFALPAGTICENDLNTEMFDEVYRSYIKSFEYDCGLINSIEPLPSLPWTEATFGCEVEYTGTNFWAKSPEIIEPAEGGSIQLAAPLSSVAHPEWISLYEAFLKKIERDYSDTSPIGQAILRGPLDILAALLGDENMIYAFYDAPELVHEIMDAAAETFIKFLNLNIRYHRDYFGGGVVGQYHIWVPGTAARLQNDAMSLLSPELYEEFALPYDRRIAEVADYNLYHIHSSAFHLLDLILSLDRVQIIQVSKDEGRDSIDFMLDGLKKIQAKKKCLVLKGRLDNDRDLELIKKHLDYSGLCIQFVADSEDEADLAMSKARGLLDLK